MRREKYALIGEKLPHSYSPELHSYFGNYSYELVETSREKVGDIIRSGKWSGFNVTVPFKKTAAELCDRLVGTAGSVGAVNTVIVKDGEVIGYNTDCSGFLYLLSNNGIKVSGEKVLILGNGGAAAAVCAALKEEHAGETTIVTRSKGGGMKDAYLHTDCDVLINATPVGMYPNTEESPLDLTEFSNCKAVIDLIYNPFVTKLLYQAESLGKKAVNGIDMLAAQAAYASELFTGDHIIDDRISQAAKDISKNKRNIVLIGMPGCGKTVVGKKLAPLVNKRFWDGDDEFLKSYGVTPESYIISHGEERFREKETLLLKEKAYENSSVISCGGGAVTKKENISALRSNGIIVYIRRELSELDKKKRPLTEKFGVEELFRQRKEMYESAADIAVDFTDESATAEEIKERIEEYENSGN